MYVFLSPRQPSQWKYWALTVGDWCATVPERERHRQHKYSETEAAEAAEGRPVLNILMVYLQTYWDDLSLQRRPFRIPLGGAKKLALMSGRCVGRSAPAHYRCTRAFSFWTHLKNTKTASWLTQLCCLSTWHMQSEAFSEIQDLIRKFDAFFFFFFFV